jgi:hypothetical protein
MWQWREEREKWRSRAESKPIYTKHKVKVLRSQAKELLFIYLFFKTWYQVGTEAIGGKVQKKPVNFVLGFLSFRRL